MTKKKPLHIAIIPDGNRRWARERGLLPWKGHETSANNLRSLVEWCADQDSISVLSFWAFSTENWKRSPTEVTQLMRLFERHLKKELPDLTKNGVRVAHSGRQDRLPTKLIQLFNSAATIDLPKERLVLNLAVDYGGKDEVTRAVQKLPTGSPVTEEAIRAALDQPGLPDIDLIIRTSGEQRTSNFFLWQSTYAEWIFTDKHFPDFTPEDLAAAVDEYQKRQRRFGS